MSSLQDLEVLDRERSLALLQRVPVGRLIFTEHALPAVRPADFRWWRGDVVIRIADPAMLAAASGNRVVAFEADELDADPHGGWSVTIVGHAQLITDVSDLIELSGLFSRPQVGGQVETVGMENSAIELGEYALDQVGHRGRHRGSQTQPVIRVDNVDSEDHQLAGHPGQRLTQRTRLRQPDRMRAHHLGGL
jgi:hypothetical protein